MCLGAFAVGAMALAVATDSWLFTEEESLHAFGNTTIKFSAHIRTGLWSCILSFILAIASNSYFLVD
jgi:hypothetical protein